MLDASHQSPARFATAAHVLPSTLSMPIYHHWQVVGLLKFAYCFAYLPVGPYVLMHACHLAHSMPLPPSSRTAKPKLRKLYPKVRSAKKEVDHTTVAFPGVLRHYCRVS